MDKNIEFLFSSESFQRIYKITEKAINRSSMHELLNGGVLVGLSGGADSVMLLHLLVYYRINNFDFPIVACHINHGIRGEEAERDEEFSRTISSSLKIEFLSFEYNVPRIAKERSLGIEECAREIRYSCFNNIISSRNDISVIATAHNADDNLETVLLNIIRGTGTRGGAGIPAVRENIIRPMLEVKKSDIISSLNNASIPFVIDSTNLSSEYSRNYIRNKITPLLLALTGDPFKMFNRFSSNLRCDDDFISEKADEFIEEHKIIKNSELYSLHPALRLRVFSRLFDINISESLFNDLSDLLTKDYFSYSVRKNIIFTCERGVCRVEKSKVPKENYNIDLQLGLNSIPEYNSDLIISQEQITKTSLNVYSFSIQQDISSAIINGSLYLRPRKDGDTIFYGGMTHKIKKLFSDRKIPQTLRDKIPVLCDQNGIIWVPGFGVRDDRASKKNYTKLFAALCIKDTLKLKRFYSASEFNS